MDAKELSGKLVTKLRELAEKPDGWGDIRIVEPADARAILAAIASDAAQAPFVVTEIAAAEWAARHDIECNLKSFSTQRSAIEDARTMHMIDAAPAAPTPTVAADAAAPRIKNAPARIYLNLGPLPSEEEVEFSELHEVTWCANKQDASDIEYVLAATLSDAAQPDERAAFEWPAHPQFPTPTIKHANGSGYFTEHQMQGYANEYGELVRVACATTQQANKGDELSRKVHRALMAAHPKLAKEFECAAAPQAVTLSDEQIAHIGHRYSEEHDEPLYTFDRAAFIAAVREAAASFPTEQRMSDAGNRPAKSHCQNGGDVCLAGNRDGVCCPEHSCDIDDGVRKNPIVARKGDSQ